MTLYPIFLDLQGRDCIVVGGGKVATRKAGALQAAGAQVHVVSPKLDAAMETLSGVTCHRQPYHPSVLEGACIVIACTDDPAVNDRVYEDCRAKGIWCNVVDDPLRCDFHVPAVVYRGRLQIAVSTGAASPSLAGTIRRRLAEQFGPEFEPWLEALWQARQQALHRINDPARRRAVLQTLGSDESLERLMQSGLAGWRNWCAEQLAPERSTDGGTDEPADP
ncbi:MAG TPA: bifunctional precorrin-2 dehydrogenase/sirohydrochlorin ferrochelatase [Phycisphaerae bacterium]|nr:bifunctional precorrin-2 dehydrogenase/sirohydrochlorin ferrochelatase [Phycisphaerae bacterium]